MGVRNHAAGNQTHRNGRCHAAGGTAKEKGLDLCRSTGCRRINWIVFSRSLRGSYSYSTEIHRGASLVNESGDPKDEYFSDGLSEELIAALAQISGLKVIGRSSSFRFKDRKEELR